MLFGSDSGRNFADEWNLKFVYLSPRYPKSYGMPEMGGVNRKEIAKEM